MCFPLISSSINFDFSLVNVFLLSQTTVAAITRKIEVVDKVADADVVVEEAVTIPHKPMTTMEEQEYDQVLLLWKTWALCNNVL